MIVGVEVSVRLVRPLRRIEVFAGGYEARCRKSLKLARGKYYLCACGGRLVPAAGVAGVMSYTFRARCGRGNRQLVCSEFATGLLRAMDAAPTVCLINCNNDASTNDVKGQRLSHLKPLTRVGKFVYYRQYKRRWGGMS